MRSAPASLKWVPLAILAVLALGAFLPAFKPAYGFSSGQAASVVIGEPDFVTGVNPSNAFKTPSNFAFDPSGNIWIADSGNNRIIEEASPSPGGSTQFLDVLGQPGYTTGLGATTAAGIDNPSGMAFDSSGNLWVADTNNNRVLEFKAPFTMGEAASVVIGQPSFTSGTSGSTASSLYLPADVLFDTSGDLWVVDGGNNRVLEYTQPFSTGMSASLVLGQTSLTANSPNISASSFYYPTYATFDSSGNIWIADSGNNRILEFKGPFSTGISASLVLGQPNFTTDLPAASQSGLDLPDGLALDSSGNVWVSDADNDRVVDYPAPLTSGESASILFGEPNFSASTPALSKAGFNTPAQVSFGPGGGLWVADAYNNRLVEFTPPYATGASIYWEIGESSYGSSILQGQSNLFGPEASAVDGNGDLWVADTQNSRVVEYPAPLTTGESASLALGQLNLTRGLETVTPNGLSFPAGLAFDALGNLWVTDSANSRVLEFQAPFKTGENASVVIGQLSLTTAYLATSIAGLSQPSGIAFDSLGDLWIADSGNDRVLEFKPPFTDGMAASLVLGQAGFGTSNSGTNPGQFQGPTGLAFDSSGNLWVTDAFNNRILEFSAPFSSGELASLVVGQSTFISGIAAISASGLYLPTAVAFDRAGDMWVSDSGNDRVLEYQRPFSAGMSASVVIGQTGFTSNVPGTSSTTFGEPLALAFDSSGNLWVPDVGNNRVLEFQAGSGGSISSTTTTSSVSVSTISSTFTSSTPTNTLTSSSTRSSSNGVTTLSVTTATTSFNTSSSSTASSSTSTISTSTVPQFPMGPALVLATTLVGTLVLLSRMALRKDQRV